MTTQTNNEIMKESKKIIGSTNNSVFIVGDADIDITLETAKAITRSGRQNISLIAATIAMCSSFENRDQFERLNSKNLGIPFPILDNGDNYYKTSNQQIIDESIRKHNESIIPKDTTLYVFGDGFKCYSRNQKNANRKHNNFLKSIK